MTHGALDQTAATVSPRGGWPAGRPSLRLLEAWFTPFGLINGAAFGLAPMLLPVVALRYGVAHVGLAMGAFNLGMLVAPLVGAMAHRHRMYRSLAAACATASALPWPSA